MTNLEFKDELVTSRFSYSNSFIYKPTESIPIFFLDSGKEIPFISTARLNGKLIHDDGQILYSISNSQLGGRVITTAKMKDILNYARMPIKIKVGTLVYLMGKGFLAKINNRGSITMLFVAQIKPGINISSIDQVGFYVSRKIYETSNKKVAVVIKDFMNSHKGDILITSNLEEYVGSKVILPKASSISGMKDEMKKLKKSLLSKEKQETILFDKVGRLIPGNRKLPKS